jgi:tetratricopeptide (TPR) repeat protein
MYHFNLERRGSDSLGRREIETALHLDPGLAAAYAGDTAAAHVWLDSAHIELERQLRANSSDHRVHGALGWTYALMGKEEDALRHGRRAIELQPMSRDHLLGDSTILNLAQIPIALRRYDEALDQLEYLLSVPSMFVSPATLRSAPARKPLHTLPRVQALISRNE